MEMNVVNVPVSFRDRDGRKELERLSEQTGGRMFSAKNDERLDEIFSEILEQLRNQFVMGCAASDLSDRNLRRIIVRTKDRKPKVQTGEGHYPAGG